MRVALAQLNPLVGDLAGNGAKVLAACEVAAAAGADLVLTPELSLWGYPPRDLLLRPSLLAQQQQVLDQLASDLATAHPQLGLLVGVAEPIAEAEKPNLTNAAAWITAGQWRIVARKRLLPTYDVFDEQRYFRPAHEPSVLELERHGRRWRLGLTICEDLWVEEELQGHRLAGADPVAAMLPHRIDLLLNLSASPFGQAKAALRHRLAARAAQKLQCPVVYVNQVGGNDELVFDGSSFVVDASGTVVARAVVMGIDPNVRSSSQVLLVRAALNDPTRRLRAGMRLRARLQLDRRALPSVPFTAVVNQAGQTFVYRVGDLAALERQPGKAPLAQLRRLPPRSRFALQTPVRLGPLQGNRYPVTAGVSVGEPVITSGLLNLRHGAPVNVAPAGQP